MDLSCEHLLTILSGLRSGLGRASGKRRQSRVALTARIAMLGPNGQRQLISKRIRDISSGGIGLLSTVRMETGRTLPLVLSAPNGESRILSCQVLFCRQMAEHVYTVGCAFVEDPWKILQDLPFPAAHLT